MRVLVTNDDGVSAPGLHALAAAMAEPLEGSGGHEVLVAAPLANMSGASASVGYLGQGSRIKLDRVDLPGPELAAVPAYGVDGPPGLIVWMDGLGGFGPPADLVVSGINPGWNTGRSVLQSGTVGAALTAAQRGVSALAVSIDDAERPRWNTAAGLARITLDWLITAPAGTAVNLNVPNVEVDELRGVRVADLAPMPAVETSLIDAGDGYLQLAWTVTHVPVPEHSDTGSVRAGFAAVTLLEGVHQASSSESGEAAASLAEHLNRERSRFAA